MKIGILTFHFGNNYGGILQCYALFNYIRNVGHTVEIIDYKPNISSNLFDRITRKLKTISSPSQLLSILKYGINLLLKKKINNEPKSCLPKIFDEFRSKYLIFSPRTEQDSISTLANRYDAVIVGSDQVWTDLYSGDSTYFLDWIPVNSQVKKIAYAACSAHSKVTRSRSRELRKLLDNFALITVRDTFTQALTQSITGQKPEIVADPTLLYDFKEFIHAKKGQEYILSYILDDEINGGHFEALEKIKKNYGNLPVKLIYIPGKNTSAKKFADEILTNVTPEKWVNLFANAKFVYTDSFHGVMFSIKFNKPFLAYYTNPVRASRLIDLKKRFPNLPIIQTTTEIPVNFQYEIITTGLVDGSLDLLKNMGI